MKTLTSKQRARSGFTLIEIMLVVIIIGILAAIVVPNFAKRGLEARVTGAQGSVRTIGLAIKLYQLDNDVFPPSLQALITKSSEPKWNGPYLEKGVIPKDPWGRDFVYTAREDSFEIKSLGPDGADGTADDISNLR